MKGFPLIIKPALFITIFCLMTSSDYAQKYLVKNPYNNSIYRGMTTALEAIVEGFSCKSIILKASNGKVKKEACDFTYYSGKVGIDKITIFVKTRDATKKIGFVYFDIKEIPDPEAYVGGVTMGTIKKGFLNAQQGVGASFLATSYGHRESVIVDSFIVIILRDRNIIFPDTNRGNIFKDSVKTAFESLQKSDKVIIANITTRKFDSMSIVVRPIEFEID